MNKLWILAQAQAQAENQEEVIFGEPLNQQETETQTIQPDNEQVDEEAPPQQQIGLHNILFFAAIALLMYFLLFRGPRKRQQEHQKMVQSVEKNDKIRTIGGIIGTVVDVKDDQITVKIDESTNTKMKIIPSAIAANLSKETK